MKKRQGLDVTMEKALYLGWKCDHPCKRAGNRKTLVSLSYLNLQGLVIY